MSTTGPSTQFPDAMRDIRQFLRTSPYIAPISAGRVFFRIPDKDPASPFMRISGSEVPWEDSEFPFEKIMVTIEAWGTAFKDYTEVRKLTRRIKSALHTIPIGEIVGNQTRIHAAKVVSTMDSPDPTTGWPRKILITQWTVSL